MELNFINSLWFCFKQKNKLLILILLVFISMFSVYIPYDLLENDEHSNNYGSLFKYYFSISAASFNKIRNQSKTLLRKIFKSTIMQLYAVVLANIRRFLFNKSFSRQTILYLFYLICFYFNGGKFKENIGPVLQMTINPSYQSVNFK